MLLYPHTWAELGDQLSVSAVVTDKVGSKLNVDEKFRITVRVKNLHDPPNQYMFPIVHFIDLHLQVYGSQFTRPVNPEQSDHHERRFAGPLTAQSPWTNHFEMQAVSEIIDPFQDLIAIEKVAWINFYASLDTTKYYRFKSIIRPAHEIDPVPID